MTHDLAPYEIQRQQQNREINGQRLWDAKQKPCADCGLRWHPHTMTLDHIDRRVAINSKHAKQLGSVLHYNPEIFLRVLNGCSAVCRNCHNIREMRRDLDDPKVSKRNRAEMIRLLDQCTRGALLDENPNV